MHLSRPGPKRSRVVAMVAALVTVIAMLAVPSQSAQAAPPPNPTDGQINGAKAQKSALANQVGSLGAQVASLQSELRQMQVQLDMAEQKYAYARQLLEQAQEAAVLAKQNAAKAAQAVAAAQREFISYAQTSYMSGNVSGTTGTLLTASDPNVFLQQGALAAYQSAHQLGAVGDMQRAEVGKSNADAAARKAVQNQTAAAAAAKKAQQAAVDAYAATQQQQTRTEATLATTQTQLSDASAQLATLNGQRATYNAYVAEQKRLAAIRYQQYLQRQREAAAALAAREAQAAVQAQHQREINQSRQNSGGSSQSGSSGSSQQSSGSNGGGYSAPSPSGGSWTAAKGRAAANRALNWLGETYIWAGGNASGPTDGGCTDPIAACGVVGFDCSGLSLYAWAPYTSLAHYTVTQYYYAGSYHPSPGNFQPGDLLFWGTTSDIHHVAIYIGNGNVVQAPESGSYVMITPWNQVSYDYYGATRPMT